MVISNLWDANHQRQGWHDKVAKTLALDVNAGRDPLTTGGLYGHSTFTPAGGPAERLPNASTLTPRGSPILALPSELPELLHRLMKRGVDAGHAHEQVTALTKVLRG